MSTSSHAASSRRHRPVRPAVPSLPPLEALDRTHHDMLVVLEKLEQLPDEYEREGDSTALRQAAKDASAFFAQVAQQHHQAEEQLVFPALLAGTDIALIEQVRRLQQDHGWLEEDWLELAPQLAALGAGDGGVDSAMFRHLVEVFAGLYREHIALEESLVYPAARRLQQREAEAVAQRRSS